MTRSGCLIAGIFEFPERAVGGQSGGGAGCAGNSRPSECGRHPQPATEASLRWEAVHSHPLSCSQALGASAKRSLKQSYCSILLSNDSDTSRNSLHEPREPLPTF